MDNMITHGISQTSVYRCVWAVVDAVNATPGLEIEFPKDHEKQKEIARGFQKKSQAGFDCCVGAIDGILIWMTKPPRGECDSMQVGQCKFSCGKKNKYDLNMMATYSWMCTLVTPGPQPNFWLTQYLL